MEWPSAFLVFFLIFSLFSPASTASSSSSKRTTKPPVVDELTTTENVKYSMMMLNQQVPSYNTTNLNQYQVIISYIMDNFKDVYLADVLTIAEHIMKYSTEKDIDPLLLTALVGVESNFNKYAVSKSGAKGLGQLMPTNLQCYQVSDPYDIKQNLHATSKMLKELLVTWKGDVQYALASYFQGINAIRRNRDNPFPAATSQYVYAVISRYNALKKYL